MTRKIMVAMLVVSLTCAWVSLGAAGEIGYTLKSADQGFAVKAPPEATSAGMMADALIGRPLGLGVTALGTALFVVTTPFHLGSGSTREAARGLVVNPAGWTFARPMGRGDARFEDPGVFPK